MSKKIHVNPYLGLCRHVKPKLSYKFLLVCNFLIANSGLVDVKTTGTTHCSMADLNKGFILFIHSTISLVP